MNMTFTVYTVIFLFIYLFIILTREEKYRVIVEQTRNIGLTSIRCKPTPAYVVVVTAMLHALILLFYSFDLNSSN